MQTLVQYLDSEAGAHYRPLKCCLTDFHNWPTEDLALLTVEEIKDGHPTWKCRGGNWHCRGLDTLLLTALLRKLKLYMTETTPKNN